MAIVVVLAILFSCILLILCLPITYALTVHIGTPFQVEGQGSWGRKLADASWSYSLGEEPHHELHTCWKRSPAVKEPVETSPPTPEEAKKAWEELEKESQHLTYEDLLREKGPEAPESTESGSPKKKPPICQLLPGIFNTPLMNAAPPQVKEALAASVPFPKRLGNAEDYASLALQMITNGYFNGEDVRLDGAIRMAPR